MIKACSIDPAGKKSKRSKTPRAPKFLPRAYMGHETDGRKTPREPGKVVPVAPIKRAPRRRPEFDPAPETARLSLRNALREPAKEPGWVWDLVRHCRKACEELNQG